jgi:hypothetical protein
MRRIIALLSVLSVMAIIAAMMPASAAPVFAQGDGARVIPCSDIFGPEVTGVIVFTPGGTPSNFACQGGPFG